jgi:hypothetical protein
MKSRNASITLIVILLILAFAVFKKWQEPERKEVFDRDPEKLVFTRHGKCRMQCRMISLKEIQEILDQGIINFSKSRRNDQPCPTFALQGRTSDRQYIRVIFAQCPEETRVVTCYDLEKDYPCSCSGDDNKN